MRRSVRWQTSSNRASVPTKCLTRDSAVAKVKRVTPEMEEEVVAFLHLKNPRKDSGRFRMLFSCPWRDPEDPIGYALMANDRVVGFIGTIFSQPVIGGRPRRFCNLTDWWVDEHYRGNTMLLLMPVLGMKEHTITNLSLSPLVYRIHSKLGFSHLDEKVHLLLPVPGRLRDSGRAPVSILLDKTEIETVLQGDDLRIFLDHKDCLCSHMVLQRGNEVSYVIFTKRRFRHIRFTHVHYVSNDKVFLAALNDVRCAFFKINHTFLTMLDERLTGTARVPGAVKVRYPSPTVFRSPDLTREQISNLYSDLVLNDSLAGLS